MTKAEKSRIRLQIISIIAAILALMATISPLFFLLASEPATAEAEVANTFTVPTPTEEPTEAPTEPTTIPTEPEPTEPTIPEQDWSEEATHLAKTVWGEARGCSVTEQAAVVWCILNRVDHPDFPDTIIGVVTQPCQFEGYSPNFPVEPEHYELALDVIERWQKEKYGFASVGRVLPPEYVYFHGANGHNWFRDRFSGSFRTWDWTLKSPYEGGNAL